MELADWFSIYKRGESLRSQAGACGCGIRKKCASSNAARGLAFRPSLQAQKSPRTPYVRSTQTTFRHLPHPNFSVFHPSFKKFLKNFSPRVSGTVRRALNRHTVPSRRSKTPKFRGKTAHLRLAAAPKTPAKTRLQAPKNPPLTHLREKKLSKVRSTLLTHPLRGCILEYMRLKEPRRPPHAGRHAQHRPPPKLSN